MKGTRVIQRQRSCVESKPNFLSASRVGPFGMAFMLVFDSCLAWGVSPCVLDAAVTEGDWALGQLTGL